MIVSAQEAAQALRSVGIEFTPARAHGVLAGMLDLALLTKGSVSVAFGPGVVTLDPATMHLVFFNRLEG